MKTLLAKPTIKIIAVDYLDDVGPTPVYVGRAEINGIAVVFDVCNNRCDYLKLFDSPDIPISKTQNINSSIIDHYYNHICDHLVKNVPVFYKHQN